ALSPDGMALAAREPGLGSVVVWSWGKRSPVAPRADAKGVRWTSRGGIATDWEEFDTATGQLLGGRKDLDTLLALDDATGVALAVRCQTAQCDRVLELVDASGVPTRPLLGLSDASVTAAFSADGSTVAAAPKQWNTARIWETASGRSLAAVG